MQIKKFMLSSFLVFMTVQFAHAEKMKADNEFARICNTFADETLELHQKIIDSKGDDIKVVKTTGGYAGMQDFYEQEKYIDKKTGEVVSVVTWERENPELMHTIEVFIRDNEGRVIRDYAAAYLPSYRNAPTQTLITLHQYNDKLHAFRTFDAVGDRLTERCTGTYKGKEVNLLLDEDDLIDAMHGDSNAMEHPEYKACFAGLADEVGDYTSPQ